MELIESGVILITVGYIKLLRKIFSLILLNYNILREKERDIDV